MESFKLIPGVVVSGFGIMLKRNIPHMCGQALRRTRAATEHRARRALRLWESNTRIGPCMARGTARGSRQRAPNPWLIAVRSQPGTRGSGRRDPSQWLVALRNEPRTMSLPGTGHRRCFGRSVGPVTVSTYSCCKAEAGRHRRVH